MRTKRIIIGLAVAGVVAGGTAAAVAATGAKDAERAVLSDAAQRLDVTPEELRSALAAAREAQLDAEVKAGRLTQEQADEIKKHLEDEGAVLGPGPGGPGPHHRGPHGGPGIFEDAAEALGIDADELAERLRDGTTFEQIAKGEGKTLAEVKDAVVAAARKRLDADVQAGRLTDEQRKEMLEHLSEQVEDLGAGPDPGGPGMRGPGHGGPWGP